MAELLMQGHDDLPPLLRALDNYGPRTLDGQSFLAGVDTIGELPMLLQATQAFDSIDPNWRQLGHNRQTTPFRSRK